MGSSGGGLTFEAAPEGAEATKLKLAVSLGFGLGVTDFGLHAHQTTGLWNGFGVLWFWCRLSIGLQGFCLAVRGIDSARWEQQHRPRVWLKGLDVRAEYLAATVPTRPPHHVSTSIVSTCRTLTIDYQRYILTSSPLASLLLISVFRETAGIALNLRDATSACQGESPKRPCTLHA